MDYLFQRVSYLKGLVEGLKIDEDTDEGKVIVSIIDTLEDIVETMNGMVVDHEELEDFVSFIDEDLTDVEEELYGVSEEDIDLDDWDDFDDYDDYEEFETFDTLFDAPEEEEEEEEEDLD